MAYPTARRVPHESPCSVHNDPFHLRFAGMTSVFLFGLLVGLFCSGFTRPDSGAERLKTENGQLRETLQRRLEAANLDKKKLETTLKLQEGADQMRYELFRALRSKDAFRASAFSSSAPLQSCAEDLMPPCVHH